MLDSTENMTPLPSDADAYAIADERFEYNEERERDRRYAPTTRRDYPISDEDRVAGQQDIKDAHQLYSDVIIDHYTGVDK